MVGEVVLQGGGAMALGVGVGVVAIGEEDDADVHAFGEEEVDGTEGGLDASGVAVVEDGDVGGVALDEAYLLDGEAGAAGGYGVLDAGLVHGDDVDVAFDEVALVGLGDGCAGLEEAVEGAGLVVDVAVGRVDVFGGLLLGAEDAAGEAEDAAGDAVDGEHDAAAEAVVGPALQGGGRRSEGGGVGRVCVPTSPLRDIFEDGEACLVEDGVAVAAAAGVVGEGCPLVEAVAEAEAADDFVGEAAGVEIGEADGAPHFVAPEEVGEVLLRELGEVEEGVALVLPFALLFGLLLFADFDVVFFGQVEECFGVGEVLVLFEEGDDVAGFAAAEAFEYALGGGDVEGGSLLVVEGAAADVVGAALFEGHEVADDVLDAGGIHDALYGLLVYHFGGAKIRLFSDMQAGNIYIAGTQRSKSDWHHWKKSVGFLHKK